MFCKGQLFLIFSCFVTLRRPRHRHLRGGEHVFDKDAVTRGGVIDEHVGHRSDQLAVLDDR